MNNKTILDIFAIKLEKHNFEEQTIFEIIECLRPILIWAEDFKKDSVAVPCSCPKGGVFSDGALCDKCNGSEYIDMPKRSDKI